MSAAPAQTTELRALSPEMRARIVSEAMGLGTIEERKKRIYASALEQIRNAEAVARGGGLN